MKSIFFLVFIFDSILCFSQKLNLPESAYKKALKIGSKAQNFTSFTLEGKELSLNEVIIKNKYILVQFWASWCLPCRKEIPNLKYIYSKFHIKGFEILSVSLDFNTDDWKLAITEDSIPWLTVSELSGRNETAAKIYKINALPAAILVDSSGKIIALDLPGSTLNSTPGSLRGKYLYTKLEELMLESE